MNFISKIPDILLGILAILNGVVIAVAFYTLPLPGSPLRSTLTILAIVHVIALDGFGLSLLAPALRKKYGRVTAIFATSSSIASLIGFAIIDPQPLPGVLAGLAIGMGSAILYLVKHKVDMPAKAVVAAAVLPAIINIGAPITYKAATNAYLKRDQALLQEAEDIHQKLQLAGQALSGAFSSFQNGEEKKFVDFAKVPGLKIGKVARTRYAYTHAINYQNFDCEMFGQNFNKLTDYSALHHTIYAKSILLDLFGGKDSFTSDRLIRDKIRARHISDQFLSEVITQQEKFKEYWDEFAKLCKTKADAQYTVIPASRQELDQLKSGILLPLNGEHDYDLAVQKVLEAVHKQPLEIKYQTEQ